jgi:hypothetical protein
MPHVLPGALKVINHLVAETPSHLRKCASFFGASLYDEEAKAGCVIITPLPLKGHHMIHLGMIPAGPPGGLTTKAGMNPSLAVLAFLRLRAWLRS